MKKGQGPFRLGHLLIGAFLWLVFPAFSAAQVADDTPLSTVKAPVGAAGEAYQQALRGSSVRSQAIYSDDEVFGPGQEKRIKRARREREISQGPSITMDSGWSVAFAVLLLLAALLLWMKFGGSGMLLSREPREIKPGQTAPDSWRMAEDAGPIDGRVLIGRLREMADRQEALVLLLRHALMSAGTACETRFARADTEREAFSRLPRTWGLRPALADILRTTELAHYGGRSVADSEFEDALSKGEMILMGGKGRIRAE